MLAPFPRVFRATVSRTFGSRARVDVLSRDIDASPEHLALASLGTCLLRTFDAFAERHGIVLLDWEETLTGTVERTPEGLMFTSIVLSIELEVDGNVHRVDAALDDAKQYCLVLSSLRVPVVIEARVRTPAGEPADEPAPPRYDSDEPTAHAG